VRDRRARRLARPSKFDLQPTPEQMATDAALAALANPAATDFAGVPPSQLTAIPQQTRHARRLYVGNLPPHITEDAIHVEFRRAIEIASPTPLSEDPVLSTYINHERRFCFVEFKTVEMATACMNLDGLHVQGVPVKVKRPNDYNANMAPKIHPSALPPLDVSKLGIVSGTVEDGPNKIFIGGLHYHLQDSQVMELLQAFGKIKAFHLVSNDPESNMSKGYCFVEYADPNITPIAVQGLNGMDIGNGKALTARLAGDRTGGAGGAAFLGTTAATDPLSIPNGLPAAVATRPLPGAPPPPDRTVVQGYDVETLVDAALGQVPMPAAPIYQDALGMPLTRIVPVLVSAAASHQAVPTLAAVPAPPMGAHAIEPQNGVPNIPTRVLVLHNMVTDEDLATDTEYQGLFDEVKDECAKFGRLERLEIPRQGPAARKVFLGYVTVAEAMQAQHELQGRQFGPNVVQTTFFPESEFEAGRLY
jgi:splicing factor U2AF subunit